jgi:hypothetical protein
VHGGERKRDEEERERCHDALLNVRECADEENVKGERMEDGSQRRHRDQGNFEEVGRNVKHFIVL